MKSSMEWGEGFLGVCGGASFLPDGNRLANLFEAVLSAISAKIKAIAFNRLAL